MNFRRAAVCGLIAVAACCWTTAASSQTIAEKGRNLLDKHRPSVVTVSMVVKIKMSFPGMGSRENELRMESTATVIDPSGLAVTSLNEVDPTGILDRMSGMGGGFSEASFESNVEEAEYILETGDEIDVEIVLRDPDLDLAFFRPKEPVEEDMAFIDLADPSGVALLDQVLVLNRLGRVANRAYSVSIEWIEAIMDRPRTFYIPGKQETRSGLGSPVFTLDGDVVGFVLVRAVQGSGGAMGMFGGGEDNMTAVILPAEDVASLIPQALESEGEPVIDDEPLEDAPALEDEAVESGV